MSNNAPNFRARSIKVAKSFGVERILERAPSGERWWRTPRVVYLLRISEMSGLENVVVFVAALYGFLSLPPYRWVIGVVATLRLVADEYKRSRA